MNNLRANFDAFRTELEKIPEYLNLTEVLP
jgi:hypothetical protein